jgi:predicted RNA binding protein YcfA (HicA-like mRNA interferase family)
LRLPRDLSGAELASRLSVYGYRMTRQTGSHIRLTALLKGHEHHVTVPAHRALRVGTLSAIVNEVARFLEIDREKLAGDLF